MEKIMVTIILPWSQIFFFFQNNAFHVLNDNDFLSSANAFKLDKS